MEKNSTFSSMLHLAVQQMHCQVLFSSILLVWSNHQELNCWFGLVVWVFDSHEIIHIYIYTYASTSRATTAESAKVDATFQNSYQQRNTTKPFVSAAHRVIGLPNHFRPIWRVGSPYNGHTQLNCRISLGSAGQVCPCVAGNGSRLLMPNEDKLSCQTWTCRLRPENTNRCPRSMMTGSWGNWWRRGSTSALGNHKFSSLPNDLLTGRFIK